MRKEDLAPGNQLDAIINYYTDVLADLADPDKKEKALYALLSSGNPEVVAGGENTFITGVRNDIITDVIALITTRKNTKQSEFDALGNEPDL